MINEVAILHIIFNLQSSTNHFTHNVPCGV